MAARTKWGTDLLQSTLTRVLALAITLGFTAPWDAPSSIAQEATYYVANTRPPDAFLALRTAPSAATGTRIGVLPNGTQLKVLDRRNDGWWLVRVTPSGEEGWVLSARGERTWVVCCADQSPATSIQSGLVAQQQASQQTTQAPEPQTSARDHASSASSPSPAEPTGRPDRYAQSRPQQQERPPSRAPGSDAQKAQDRYNKYKQQQEEQAAASDRETNQIRKIEQQIDGFPIEASSDGPVREFCRATLQSNDLSPTVKASIRAKCYRNLEAISYKKAAQAELDNERNSDVLYKKLAAELEAMPPTAETVRQLRHLLVNNNYRLPQLSFHYQNNYFESIQDRLGTIEASMSERIYAELVDKRLAVPPTLRNARIIDGLSGISFMQFLCGALISAQKVTLTENGRLIDIRIDDFNLRFAVVRYMTNQKMIIPTDSPLQGGTTALSLEAVTENGRPLNIGNPMAFVTNFYSQWTPHLAAYLKQNGAP